MKSIIQNLRLNGYILSNFYLFKEGDNLGIMDSNKEVLIPPNFKEISVLDDTVFKAVFHETLIEKITNKSRCQFFNFKGKAITPILVSIKGAELLGKASGTYDKMTLLVKNSDRKFGIFSLEGNQLVDYIYDEVDYFHPYNNAGAMQVCVNNKWGIIDSFGNILLDLKYLAIGKFPYQDFSEHNLVPIFEEDTWGLINDKYEVVIPSVYNHSSWFDIQSKTTSFIEFKDQMLLPVNKDRMYGYINNKNEIVLPFVYDYASIHENGLAKVMKEGKWIVIDLRGKIIK